jgi:Flp pilus assembly protein TadG
MGAETGQDLVEYALVLPLFLLLVFSVFEFGILFFQYTLVVNAAREGARAGIVIDTEACPRACLETKVKNAAAGKMAGTDPADLSVFTTWPAAGSQPLVSVTVRYRTGFMTQMLIETVGGNGSVTLESTATMQREF